MGVVVKMSDYWRAGPGPTRRRRRGIVRNVLPSNPARELILPDPSAPGVVVETLDPTSECASEGFGWAVWIDDPDGFFADRLEVIELADAFRGIDGVFEVHSERGGCFHVRTTLAGVDLRRKCALVLSRFRSRRA